MSATLPPLALPRHTKHSMSSPSPPASLTQAAARANDSICGAQPPPSDKGHCGDREVGRQEGYWRQRGQQQQCLVGGAFIALHKLRCRSPGTASRHTRQLPAATPPATTVLPATPPGALTNAKRGAGGGGTSQRHAHCHGHGTSQRASHARQAAAEGGGGGLQGKQHPQAAAHAKPARGAVGVGRLRLWWLPVWREMQQGLRTLGG